MPFQPLWNHQVFEDQAFPCTDHTGALPLPRAVTGQVLVRA